MANDEREPTQPTQPKGIDPTTGKPYEPVEIPVPKRSTFDKLLGRAEKRPAKENSKADSKADMWTRNSYFGFVIGLLDRPAHKDSTRPSDPPTRRG